jgi:DNA-binding Lrp family transcriptional regulator
MLKTIVEIARAAGVTETTVRNRFKDLKELGIKEWQCCG